MEIITEVYYGSKPEDYDYGEPNLNRDIYDTIPTPEAQ